MRLPDELLKEFVQFGGRLLRGYFAERNQCVAAVRVVKESLEPYGFVVEPVPVRMVVQSHKHNVAFVAGASAEDQRILSARAASHERRYSGTRYPWNGHVIAVIDRRWVLDPTFDQASAPDRGMPIDEMLLIDTKGLWGEPFESQYLALTAQIGLDNGLELKVNYQPTGDFSFLDAPAWETDHIEPVIELIRERLGQVQIRGEKVA